MSWRWDYLKIIKNVYFKRRKRFSLSWFLGNSIEPRTCNSGKILLKTNFFHFYLFYLKVTDYTNEFYLNCWGEKSFFALVPFFSGLKKLFWKYGTINIELDVHWTAIFMQKNCSSVEHNFRNNVDYPTFSRSDLRYILNDLQVRWSTFVGWMVNLCRIDGQLLWLDV